MTDLPFRSSAPLTLGVELELQLLSTRTFDLTRGASDILNNLHYDECYGEIKYEITESMLEISTLPCTTANGILDELSGLSQVVISHCESNNINVCGGGTHPFHFWPDRRICPGERFGEVSKHYGYLAKQFTVFGQHIHIGCVDADDAIWLTQALQAYVPYFIALSASSPFLDGEDTLFHSSRLNVISAFPLSGQCPEFSSWAEFIEYFRHLEVCGVVSGIKDLYWDIRPKPEYGTVEIRVCDTPITVRKAAALAAFAQCLARKLLLRKSENIRGRVPQIVKHNKFQACRYGLEAILVDPDRKEQVSLREKLHYLFNDLAADAEYLQCSNLLEYLWDEFKKEQSDALWLRQQFGKHRNLNDVVAHSAKMFMTGAH